MDARGALLTKYLPFTREIRKFCLENQMVRVLLFEELQTPWNVIRGDAIFHSTLFRLLRWFGCTLYHHIVFERRTWARSVVFLHSWAMVSPKFLRLNRRYWVKALSKTNLVASSHVKREESSLPVDLPRSKTSLLKVSYNSVSAIHSVDLQIHFARVCCYMGTPDSIYEGRLALLQLHVRSRLAL